MTSTMMTGPLGFIALALLLSARTCQATSLKDLWLRGYLDQSDLPALKSHRELLTDATITSLHHRSLQQVPVATTRQCDQDLGITPKEVISQLVNALAGALGNVTLDQTVNYDVQSVILCGSCQSVATPELLADMDQAGFGYYCREGAYGYDVTTSGVLFLPIDPETGEIIANKKLKGSVFAHSLTTDTTKAPSEIMPEDLAAFIESVGDPVIAIGALFNVAGGILSASTGVVSVVPDYVGFGQSQVMSKSLGGKLHRLATIPLWLTAQEYVTNTTGGCTELDNIVTVGGYSEGGYASFAISLALNRLGVDILTCNSGAAPWDGGVFLQYHIEDFDNGNVDFGVAGVMAYLGATASSTDPDAVNTNVGQDLLLKEWMNPNNFSMWAEGWISTNFSIEDYLPFIPLPNYWSMVNPNVTNMYRNAIATNVSDGCTLAVEGETDKFCELVAESSLSDELTDPPFPVVLCHSPEDELIPYSLHPNVSASENLTDFSLLGQMATGSHAEAALFCFFPMLLPFTVFNTGPSAIEQVPLDTCASSPTTAPAPTEAPPPTEATPTETPTSDGYSGYASKLTAMASLVSLWAMQ